MSCKYYLRSSEAIFYCESQKKHKRNKQEGVVESKIAFEFKFVNWFQFMFSYCIKPVSKGFKLLCC